MTTRRQRLILDLLIKCHALEVNPSPAHLARLLVRATGWPTGTSPQAVRDELVRLYEAGAILHIAKGSGTAATQYALAECDCPRCVDHRV